MNEQLQLYNVRRMMSLQRGILWGILATWIIQCGIFVMHVINTRDIRALNARLAAPVVR